ncbi:hypothetical protein P3T73_04945 [Kiritimatiellota bacterium B12222]|nr:hypothetical protein P3T73_04945 [Kiritimatiellota bacterium B12222]
MHTSRTLKFAASTLLLSIALPGVLIAEEMQSEENADNAEIVITPELLAQFDVDQDGKLSKKEQKAMKKAPQESSQEIIAEIAPVPAPSNETEFNAEVNEMKDHQKEYDDRASDNSADKE